MKKIWKVFILYIIKALLNRLEKVVERLEKLEANLTSKTSKNTNTESSEEVDLSSLNAFDDLIQKFGTPWLSTFQQLGSEDMKKVGVIVGDSFKLLREIINTAIYHKKPNEEGQVKILTPLFTKLGEVGQIEKKSKV